MNLNRRTLVGQADPVYFGPGFGPNYTPPFLPSAPGETYPADRTHELPEISVRGTGPWTYVALAALAVGLWYASKE